MTISQIDRKNRVVQVLLQHEHELAKALDVSELSLHDLLRMTNGLVDAFDRQNVNGEGVRL